MVTAQQLVYEFKRRLHHRNSSYSKALLIEDICSYLTEGLMTYYKNRVIMAEASPLIQSDLRPYEIKEVELSFTNKDKYVIAEYKKDHYQLIRKRILATKEGCEPAELDVRVYQSNDVNHSLSNEMLRPSFEWRETVADEGEEGLYIWHNNEFTIQKVIVDYYKKPEDIHAPSLKAEGEHYVSWDGTIKVEDTVLEMPTYAFKDIADIAVLIALRDIGDMKDFQTQLRKILDVSQIGLQ